ncbi:MAG: DUF4097 family beta strand repeat protein [Alphaproteobacteria bacterium]|nr:DUF4097 family beta strand repeat protein [Alphaproteobacteria bacterium]
MPLLALASLLSLGCVVHVQEDTETRTFTDPVTVVRVRSDAGDIRFDGRDGADATELTITHEYGREPAVVRTELSGGVLDIDVDCTTIVTPCRAHLDLVLPPDVDLDVDTRAGNVGARDIDGQAILITGAGDLRVEYLSGALYADTSAGDIDGVGLTGRDIEASSGAGRLDLQTLAPPARLIAESGAGDISLRVPSGTYAVSTDTSAGDITVSGITDEDDADDVIVADTRAGDIYIQGE